MACIIISKSFCVLVFILCAVYYNVEAAHCIWGYLCPGPQQCCNENNVCRDNCIGEPCSLHTDCASGEFCCEGKCTLNCSTSCRWGRSGSDCLPGEHCCADRGLGKYSLKCAKSCIGKWCERQSHCADGEYCCGGRCASNCSFCSALSDCKTGETCCDLGKKLTGFCGVSCAGQSCDHHNHCGLLEYCCGHEKKCSSNCPHVACTSHRDCHGSCCNGRCASTCVGKFCVDDSDCGSGQHCCGSWYKKCYFDNCTGKSCNSNSDCPSNECCQLDKTCGLNCTGTICRADSDCRNNETCCGLFKSSFGKCVKSCTRTCSFNSDCASHEVCCESKCALSCNGQFCSYRHCAKDETCCSSTTCSESCIGFSCNEDDECALGEICCKDSYYRQCAKSCNEKSCSSNEDCPGLQCCGEEKKCDPNSTCESESSTWVNTPSVVGTIVAFVLIIAIAGLLVAKEWRPFSGRQRHRAHQSFQSTRNVTTQQQQQRQQQQQQRQQRQQQHHQQRPPELTVRSPPPYSNALQQLPHPDEPPPSYESVVMQSIT